MELVSDRTRDDQEGTRRRDRFIREREDEPSDSSTRKEDLFRDSSVRSSRKRSSSISKSNRDDEKRVKHRRSISPRGGSYRFSRNDGDKYVPSYGRDGYSSSRSRFPGRMAPDHVNMMGSGYPDSGANKVVDPLDFNYLITPSQFAEYLIAGARSKNPRGGFSINPAELERRYGIYRENFINRQQELFFNMESNSEWVRERYHPVDSIPLRKEVNQRRLGLIKIFEENLSSGVYDSICYDEVVNLIPPKNVTPQDDKNEDSDCKDSTQNVSCQNDASTLSQDKNLDSEPRQKEATPPQENYNKHEFYDLSIFKASDPSTNALFIRAVPPSIKREAIVEMCSSIKGFKYLCLSDPKPEKDMHRLGWIIFDKDTDMEAAYRAFYGQNIDNFTFHVQSHRDMEQRVRLVSPESNTKERLEMDLEQIKELTKVLEDEVGIYENFGTSKIEERVAIIFENMPKDQEEIQGDEQGEELEQNSLKRTKLALDLHITYLRCVHQYDYYGSIECISPEDFFRRSFVYLRRSASDKFFKKGWAEQLNFKTNLRIHKPDSGPEILKIGGRSLDVELDKGLSKHVKKEGEGKRRCRQCGKLFKAEQFVRKHIKLKHPSITNAIEEDIKFFNSFVRDQQRADSFRYYLNAGGSIINLGLRNQSQMGTNLLMNRVAPQFPGFLSMMPGRMPGMGKNMNIVAFNAFMMNLSRMRQKAPFMGAHPGSTQRPRQSQLPIDHNAQYFAGEQGTAHQGRLARDRPDYRVNANKWSMSYRDLDAVEYEGDLKIVYD